ncbi:MAG: C4-dicarboxylate ABC transporter substrate-binding protein [Betaproteobacteria bacterium]|nr:C4-dicarboxylate ABC transporter substrate-binding protein [Betaproteobacteria bacterium]MBI2958669.1 C4-dicarboxylate ABC transporter substrate-binding protein [Betaproteobacteria bacterium]
MNLRRLKPSRLSKRDLAAIGLPAIALIVAAFWVAYLFVEPAPPDRMVMTTGSEEGAYHAFALQYQEILARHGITLELRPSSGSVENLRRLTDDESGVDIGLVQSGTGDVEQYDDLATLGSVYYEPVWVFYRGRHALERLTRLRGKRVAIGAQGSGTRRIAIQLLNANHALAAPTRTVDLGGEAAARALKQGRVDAAFIVGPAEMPVVRELMAARGVKLMSFPRAPAYTNLFAFLSAVTLPEGGIDLARNIPGRDTVLLAPTANLVARDDLHPALVSVLMQALTEAHSGPGLFHKAGDFPKFRDREFPLNPEAERYYKSGPPFLQRYLPFWAATLLDRAFIMLLPLVAVLLPLLRIAPSLYTWRIRSRIYRWYGELKFLELEIREKYDPARLPEYRTRLDALEDNANTRPIPLAFTDQVYTLRQHIDMVRGILHRVALEPALVSA